MGKHKDFYILNGKKFVASTTALGIIADEQLMKWRGRVGNRMADYIMNTKGDRGTLIHAQCQKVNEGEIVRARQYKKEIDIYKQWVFENVIKFVLVEKRLYSNKYSYCGCPDLFAILKGRKRPDVFDIKTGNIYKKMEYQLSSYKELGIENGFDIQNRIILHLSDKGIKMMPLNPDNHNTKFRIFLYAKEVYMDYNN